MVRFYCLYVVLYAKDVCCSVHDSDSDSDSNSDTVSCQLRVEFCTGGCEDRTLAREAEESPMLEAVVRERLLKTQQAG
jgi:hypothetical protein